MGAIGTACALAKTATEIRTANAAVTDKFCLMYLPLLDGRPRTREAKSYDAMAARPRHYFE
jgi:hypothetical protein